RCGELVLRLVRDDVRPSSILTREAIDNAITAIAATGGSTNGVLHLLAIAREIGLPLEIDDFDEIASRTPVVADLVPGGRFAAIDLYRAGGLGLVARELVAGGLVHEDARKVDGRTLAEIASAAEEAPGQEVVVPIDRPLKQKGGLQILRGNIAADGCVVKHGGHERKLHRRPARVVGAAGRSPRSRRATRWRSMSRRVNCARSFPRANSSGGWAGGRRRRRATSRVCWPSTLRSSRPRPTAP